MKSLKLSSEPIDGIGYSNRLQASLAELCILFPRQNQPDRTSAHADPVFDRLTAGEIELGAAVPECGWGGLG
jgi:hypothetical protein